MREGGSCGTTHAGVKNRWSESEKFLRRGGSVKRKGGRGAVGGKARWEVAMVFSGSACRGGRGVDDVFEEDPELGFVEGVEVENGGVSSTGGKRRKEGAELRADVT